MTKIASDVSHWLAKIYGDSTPMPTREPLVGDRKADVVIVGAGYTGLWTARTLLRADPSLDVVLLDAQFAGYGASGRNGGAAIAQLNGAREFWNRLGGPDGAVRMERAIQDAVRQVGVGAAEEEIDCGYSRNGFLNLARSGLEADILRQSIEEDRAAGFGEEDTVWLDRNESRERLRAEEVVGAKYNAHCASLDPGRLVRGLAEAVERLGGTIYEQTPVREITPRTAHTDTGRVTGTYVIRATEAYTRSIKGQRRRILPFHTSMIATEPISKDLWAEIGWDGREAVLAEHHFLHMQHTDDGRITIGGDDDRLPYRFGSGGSRDKPLRAALLRQYREALVRLFPPLRDVRIEHTWSGVFGIMNDWAPSVGLDRSTGIGWGGGYVGEGVAASNMAGRTLCDLILDRRTELTALPWVRRQPHDWAPEPIRYLATGPIWVARRIGEVNEIRTDKHSRLAATAVRLAGFGGRLG